MVVCEKEIVKIIDTAQRILIIMIAKNIINSQYTMNRAFIFPGQGSQSVGMGKDFFDSEKAARLVFESVDDTLGYKLSEIIFNGSSEDLAITTNTQPAIMAISMAIFKVLLEKSGKKIEELCAVVAGHSLGEYSALCGAGAMSLEDTSILLKVRATSMQEASPKGEGAMAACLGISAAKLQEIIESVIDYGVCQIANDNVEGQIVISGHEYNVDRIVAVLKDTGCRAIKLNVSAPFHSSLIKAAEVPMEKALFDINWTEPKIPLICNVTAKAETDTNQIKQNLLQQICGSVRWRETMNEFAALGITELVEVGPGKVLTGLAKKSHHNFTTLSISNLKELEEFLQGI